VITVLLVRHSSSNTIIHTKYNQTSG